MSNKSGQNRGGAKHSGLLNWVTRFPLLLQNWLSLTGFLLILIGIVTGLFFLSLELLADDPPAYLGVTYVIFLMIVMMGVIIVPVGMVLEKRRQNRKGDSSSVYWVLDLNKPGHRLALMVFLVGGVVIFLGIATASYKVYKHTGSNSFCGQLCHEVMNPEYTAYHYSAHARVKCVECHVGTGAGYYVRSKFTGLNQILGVISGNFPRPIPTPIHNLRPARETCEECHWPGKFIGYRESVRTYYMSDEANTPHQIRMLVKIGGEKSKLGSGSGIHYHMLIASKVEYIPRDEKRQDIPWVRIKHRDGRVTEFNNIENPLSEEEKKNLEIRQMDCIDCHNRPSHKFPTPLDSVNSSMEQELISTKLPFVKRETTKVLNTDFKSTDEAMVGIKNYLTSFYRNEFPWVIEKEEETLKKTIAEVQRIYGRSIFPEMKSKWDVYPDNIGHLDWPGCFRCHNDEMQSKEGNQIFTSCNKCHLILAQGNNIDQVKVNFQEGLSFFHPGDSEYVDEYTDCTECHTGGPDLYD